jgi:hypothetical protein
MLNFFKSKQFKISISLILIIFFIFSLNYKFDIINHNNKLDPVVIKIDNIEISENDLNTAIHNFKNEMLSNGQNIDSLGNDDENLIRKNILQGMINEKLLIKLSKLMNLQIDDNTIIEQIKKTPNFINEAGLFDEQKLQDFLKKNNIDEYKYIHEIKKNIILYIIFNFFANYSVENEFRDNIFFENLRRIKKVDIIEMNFDNFINDAANKIEISEKDIKDFYDSNQDLFKIPEYRSIQYSLIKLSDINKKININQDILNNKINEKLKTIKESNFSDIRSFDNIICESENDANSVISYLSNIDFEKYKNILSSKMSKFLKDELNLNCMVLDINEKQKDNLPSEFSKTIFEELKFENKLYFSKNIIETAMGKHVIVLKNKRDINFDDVKDLVLHDLKDELSKKEYINIVNGIRDSIANDNQSDQTLEKIQKLFNLNNYKKNDFTINGYFKSDEDQGNDIRNINTEFNKNYLILENNLLQNIFSSEINTINFFQINENEYILYKITNIEKSFVKSLEMSYDEIVSNLKEKNLHNKFTKKSKEIFEILKSNNSDIKNIFNNEIFSSKWIKFNKNIDIYNPFILKINQNLRNPKNYPTSLINNILYNSDSNITESAQFEDSIFFAVENSSYLYKFSSIEESKIFDFIKYSSNNSRNNEVINSIIRFLNKKYIIK